MSPAGPRVLALAVVALLASCTTKPPKPERVALEGKAVARVGNELIVEDTVASIARAQGVDTRRALDLATFDALAANEAAARGLDRGLQGPMDMALVRILVDQLREEAWSKGPPTDREIESLTRQYWLEVARPPAVVTIHAAVMVPPDAPEEAWGRALEAARKIHDAVAPAAADARRTVPPDYMPIRGVNRATEPVMDAFADLARTVPTGDLALRVEPLPPIADDDTSLEPEARDVKAPSTFAHEFVAAAFALTHRGDVSPPVKTPFGYHVILLLDRLPEAKLSFEERRRYFEHRVLEKRTEKRVAQLLEQLRSSTPIEEPPTNIDALLESVKVGP